MGPTSTLPEHEEIAAALGEANRVRQEVLRSIGPGKRAIEELAGFVARHQEMWGDIHESFMVRQQDLLEAIEPGKRAMEELAGITANHREIWADLHDSLASRAMEAIRHVVPTLPTFDTEPFQAALDAIRPSDLGHMMGCFEKAERLNRQIQDLASQSRVPAAIAALAADWQSAQASALGKNHTPPLTADSQILDRYEEREFVTVLPPSPRPATAEDVDNTFDRKLGGLISALALMEKLARPGGFHDLLQDFGRCVSRQHQHFFWENEERFRSRPEMMAQTLLSVFLEASCGKLAPVTPESPAGGGFVDILVSFLSLEFLVELKIVGPGWGVGDAERGSDQLHAYMQHYEEPEAYLVVFDGRKTSRGRRLQQEYHLDGKTVRVIVVPIKPETPSRGAARRKPPQ